MARFLFSAWPYSGHIHPCLSVALALRRAGHEVAFYTGASARASVEAENIPVFAFEDLAREIARFTGFGEPRDCPELYAKMTSHFTTLGDLSAGKRLARVQRMYRDLVVGCVPAQVSDLRRLASAWKPDMIVTDALFWGPLLVLREADGLPVSMLSFYAGCMAPGPGAPPAGFGLPRPRDLRTRMVSALARRMQDLLTRGIRAQIDGVRGAFDLPPLREPFFRFAARTAPHLVCGSADYDFSRRDLPPAVQYVGPCIYHRPPDSERGFLGHPGRPLIFASEGTCQVAAPVLLTAAAQALGGLPLDLLMTTGRQRSSSAIHWPPLAPNVRVEEWAYYPELFPRCSVIITNGGSNTTREALQAGVPVIVVPMEWDQLENAPRVEESGAGIQIPLRRLTPARLRQAVEKILHNPSYRENAQRLARLYAGREHGEPAAEILSGLVTSSAQREVGV